MIDSMGVWTTLGCNNFASSMASEKYRQKDFCQYFFKEKTRLKYCHIMSTSLYRKAKFSPAMKRKMQAEGVSEYFVKEKTHLNYCHITSLYRFRNLEISAAPQRQEVF